MPISFQETAGIPAAVEDAGHPTWALWQYVFCTLSGTALVTGHFVDPFGAPIQNLAGTGYVYVATLTTTPVTLLKALGVLVVPTNASQYAAGFIGTLNGTIAFSAGALSDFLTVPALLMSEMQAKPGQYPQFNTTPQFRLGRC